MLLCASVPEYPVAVMLAGGQAEHPVLIVDRPDRGHVIALDAAASRGGARVGQTATQALAAVPDAQITAYDAVHGRRCWEALLDAFDALTPLIEDARPGLAYLDMRGIPGDASAWVAHARAIAQAHKLPLRVGFGANKFGAYAATWIGDGVLLEAGQEARALAPLPLDVLDLDPAVLQRLHLLGIATLGELARLPHGPFVRRFGAQARRWHDCARGIDRTLFLPRGHAMTIEAALFGEGHAEEEAQVFFALRTVLARVCADLAACGKRGGALHVDIELDTGERLSLEVALATPTADERTMLDLVRAKLEGMRFLAPIVGVRVRVVQLEEGGEPLALFAAADIDERSVGVTLARLEAMLGEPVRRARLRAAHPLEERFLYEPFVLTREELRTVPAVLDTAPAPEIVPQLRLMTVREIDVRVQRGAPAFVGSPPRAVRECAGPWRIEEGWFHEPIARDEYDVVLEDGDMVRIYHQGARWYLRGAYD